MQADGNTILSCEEQGRNADKAVGKKFQEGNGMGVFGGGKTFCECGKKAGLLAKVSLKDGGYLGSGCQNKRSDQLDSDAFKTVTKEDYERNAEAAKENDRKYREEFHETFRISTGGNKCFRADETHGW